MADSLWDNGTMSSPLIKWFQILIYTFVLRTHLHSHSLLSISFKMEQYLVPLSQQSYPPYFLSSFPLLYRDPSYPFGIHQFGLFLLNSFNALLNLDSEPFLILVCISFSDVSLLVFTLYPSDNGMFSLSSRDYYMFCWDNKPFAYIVRLNNKFKIGACNNLYNGLGTYNALYRDVELLAY